MDQNFSHPMDNTQSELKTHKINDALVVEVDSVKLILFKSIKCIAKVDHPEVSKLFFIQHISEQSGSVV